MRMIFCLLCMIERKHNLECADKRGESENSNRADSVRDEIPRIV